MSKFPSKVIFNEEARRKLIKGIDILAEAVGSTLGPLGRNVAINNPHTTPTVLHDGVSVARRINLKDKFEDMGAELVKEAAVRTNEKAGDGTTTSTVLVQAIVKEAEKLVAAGINPMLIKKQLDEDLIKLKIQLSKLSKKIETDEQIEQIATISSADSVLGKLVANAIKKVGTEGVVTVDEGKGFETTVEFKEGMEIDRGYLSPHFVTDHARAEAVIDDAYILLTDKKLNYNFEIQPFMERFLKEGRKNLVIFAGECVEEALASFVVNKLRGVVNIVAITAPAYGGRRIDELEDIASLTGGSVISQDSGRTIEGVQIEELGQAERVIVDRDKTVIINGKGDKKAFTKRMADLEAQIKVSNTEFDAQIKKERLAKMAGKVAVIQVGAITESEMKERKERVIDAVNATRAAVEEGVVAGGEITLYTLSKYAKGILKNACTSPFKRLLENAGIDYAVALQKLKEYPYGVDVMDGQVKDMIKSGIIDPVKVTRSALENAVSVSSMIVTTSTLISEIEERT